MSKVDANSVAVCAQILRLPMVIDGNKASASFTRDRLREIGAPEPMMAISEAQALENAKLHPPSLFVVDGDTPGLDAIGFTRTLRRLDLSCRQAPVILVLKAPTVGLITEARDSGVHEILRRPFSLGDLFKRVQVIAQQPRDWIDAKMYVGPDRRRFNTSALPSSTDRRSKKKQQQAQEPTVLACANRLAGAIKIFELSPKEAVQMAREEYAKLAQIELTSFDRNLTLAVEALARALAEPNPVREALADSLLILGGARA